MGSSASRLDLRLCRMKGLHKIEPLEEANIPTPVWAPVNWNPKLSRRHSLPLSPKTRVPNEMPFFAKKKAKALVERGMDQGGQREGKGKDKERQPNGPTAAFPPPAPCAQNRHKQESQHHLLTSTHPLGDVPTHSNTTRLGTFASLSCAQRLLHYVYTLDPPCPFLGPAWEYAYDGPHKMSVRGWKAGILKGVKALGWWYLVKDGRRVRSVWVQQGTKGWGEEDDGMSIEMAMGMEVGFRENVRLDLIGLEWRSVGLALGEIGPVWCSGMGTAAERMGKVTAVPTADCRSYSDEVVDAVDMGLWKPPLGKRPALWDNELAHPQPSNRSTGASGADDELDDDDDRPARDTDSRAPQHAEESTCNVESTRRGIEAMQHGTLTVAELSSNAATEDGETASYVANRWSPPVAPALKFLRRSAPPSYHLHALDVALPASRYSSGGYKDYTPSGSSTDSPDQDKPYPNPEAAHFSPTTASVQQDDAAAERATARFGPESSNVSLDRHANDATEVPKDTQEFPWSPHHRECGTCSRIDVEKWQGNVPFHLRAWQRSNDGHTANDTGKTESLASAIIPESEDQARHSDRDGPAASPVEHDDVQSPRRQPLPLQNGHDQDDDLYSVSDTQSQASDDADSVAVITSHNSRSVSTEAFIKGGWTPNEVSRSETDSISQSSNRTGSTDSVDSRRTLRESAETVVEGDEKLPTPNEILPSGSDAATQSSNRTESVGSVAYRGMLREDPEASVEADERLSTQDEISHPDSDAISQSSDQPGSAVSVASRGTPREGLVEADKTLRDGSGPTGDTASLSSSNTDTVSFPSRRETPTASVEEVAQVRQTLDGLSANGEQSQLPEKPPPQSSWAAIACNANKGKENIVLTRSPTRKREENVWSYPKFEIKVPTVWQDQTPLPTTEEKRKRGGKRRRKKSKKTCSKVEE